MNRPHFQTLRDHVSRISENDSATGIIAALVSYEKLRAAGLSDESTWELLRDIQRRIPAHLSSEDQAILEGLCRQVEAEDDSQFGIGPNGERTTLKTSDS